MSVNCVNYVREYCVMCEYNIICKQQHYGHLEVTTSSTVLNQMVGEEMIWKIPLQNTCTEICTVQDRAKCKMGWSI